MTDKRSELQQATGVDDDGLVQAARYYLAERTDDLGTQAMFDEMAAHTGQADALRGELQRLTDDSQRLEDAAAALLAWAWDDPAERPAVQRAIDAAKVKLPVIEVTILGMVALYGMYLVSTGGKKSKTNRSIDKDGAVKETTTEYYPHPLASVVDLFRAGKDKG